VEIDPADYSTVAAQKQSSADAAEANHKTMLAALDLMTVKVATAEATADQSKADTAAAEATDARAQADFSATGNCGNRIPFRRRNLTPRRPQSRKRMRIWSPPDKKPSRTPQESTKPRRPKRRPKPPSAWRSRCSGRRRPPCSWRQLDLSYTKIFAPCDGRVTRKAVEPGNYVQVGQQLMSIVPADIWVVANFKESQLKKNEARPAGARGD